MAREIERKFLVKGDGWRERAQPGAVLRQGYLANTGKLSFRVRIKNEETATLTIKSAASEVSRSEFEYAIPVADACDLLAMCGEKTIEKRRYVVQVGATTWEVDVFEGAHQGLVLAEVELPDADAAFDRPEWVGAEVTEDQRYYNSHLASGETPPSA